MLKDKFTYGKCGVFCEMCPTETGKIAKSAQELLKLIKGEYSWAEESVNFSFENLRNGLEWLTKEECPTCFKIEDPWCEV